MTAQRWPAPELALAGVGLLVLFLFPYDLGLATRIAVMMIFVLSLDIVLGVAGIATLGQAAMYGAGAYAAGLFAVHVSAAPLPGLAVGLVAGAAVAAVTGLLVLRAHGLTLLMLTIAVAAVLQEIANKARPVTGGADGLSGIRMDPILGQFAFDFAGRTGFIYTVAVLLVVVFLLRRLLMSPMGLMARGLRESPERMTALGAPVLRRRWAIYTIGGAVAGLAGALAAQITELVSPVALGFTLSAEALVMLILGGTGRLWGALLGTALFMVVHHFAAAVDPFNWLFLIGGLLGVVVFFAPGGLIGVATAVRR